MIAFVVNNAAKMSASTFKVNNMTCKLHCILFFKKLYQNTLTKSKESVQKKEGETRSGENYPG